MCCIVIRTRRSGRCGHFVRKWWQAKSEGYQSERHPKDRFGEAAPQRIGPGHGSYSHSDTLSFEVDIDENGGLLERCTSDAYIRVVVNGDMSWKVQSTSTFGKGELPYGEEPN